MYFNNLERKTKAELFELIQSKQTEIDALQKRIDEAVLLLEYNEYTDSALRALDVLKGE